MNYTNINDWLNKELEKLDISPSNYKIAVERYNTVGKTLEDKLREEYKIESHIYVQGSFMIGTVVKPYGKEKEYDVDLVCECELSEYNITPKELKELIGKVLLDSIYGGMLDEEGKRTWTILYSENNDLGFHIDIQPCIPLSQKFNDTKIKTTTRYNKDSRSYKWDKGDPKGFKEWFDLINKDSFDEVSYIYKRRMYDCNHLIFASIEDVPDQLVRTKLQRIIQILKRHRDIRFENNQNKDDKPSSMIITILSSKIYKNLPNTLSLYEMLKEIANQLRNNIKLLQDNGGDIELPLISQKNEQYIIMNPVVDENLAEKWNADNNKKQEAFFQWVSWLEEDIIKLGNQIIKENETRTIDFVFNELKDIKNVEDKKERIGSGVKKIEDPIKPWRQE